MSCLVDEWHLLPNIAFVTGKEDTPPLYWSPYLLSFDSLFLSCLPQLPQDWTTHLAKAQTYQASPPYSLATTSMAPCLCLGNCWHNQENPTLLVNWPLRFWWRKAKSLLVTKPAMADEGSYISWGIFLSFPPLDSFSSFLLLVCLRWRHCYCPDPRYLPILRYWRSAPCSIPSPQIQGTSLPLGPYF